MTVLGFLVNLELESVTNTDFLRVLFTGPHSQLVVLSLRPGETTGTEARADADWFVYVTFGHGRAVLNGDEYEITDGWAIVIPAGTEHTITNVSETEVLRFYSLCSPPNHPAGSIHETKKREVGHY